MKSQTLLQEMRDVLRRYGYAYSTEKPIVIGLLNLLSFMDLKN